MEKKTIFKNIYQISGSTLISRILGYLRDMAIAHFFGATFIADTFYVAYRIPNLLRRLLGEGALISAFVPTYTEYLHSKTKEEQEKFLSAVWTILCILLLVITILGMIFTPILVRFIAPGFYSDPEKFRLSVILTRIMFPFFIAIGTAAFFMGILYAQHIFVYSALSSCFLSISELLFMFLVCPFMENPILGLAFGVVVGGFLQSLFQFIPIFKQKLKLFFNFDIKDSGLRQVAVLMLPATIGVSVDQISAFVDVICASFLREGSVSALYYSNHLMQLPLALFGVAVSAVSLPMLSKSANFEDFTKLKSQLADSLSIMTYLILPSTIGLIILSEPIIRLLFERGKFTHEATLMSSSALKFYSLGIIAYSTVKIVSTAYYSLKDTKTPVKIAAFCVFLNVFLNIILMRYLEVGGLALATAISSFVNAILLLYFLRRKIGLLGLSVSQRKHNFAKIFISAVFMGFTCLIVYKNFENHKILAVLMPIIIGEIVYFGMTYLLKVEEILHILKKM